MADRYANKQNYYPMESDPYGRPDYSNPKPKSEWITEEQIKSEWRYKNIHATYEGSTLHDYIENYISNKIKPEPKISPEGLMFEEIESTYNIMKVLCGMVDQIFWNVKYQCLQIWDWKTNTLLKMYNEYGNKMKHCLKDLDVCEFNTYSLQLNVYKKIIERNTNLRFGDCYLVWYNEENSNYEIIKCEEYSHYVDDMFHMLQTERELLFK